jgi:hypothetical protein
MSSNPAPSLTEFLQTWPLYKSIEVPVTQEAHQAVIFLPKRIVRYCDAEQCRREMEWETWANNTDDTKLGVRTTAKYGDFSRNYKCRHCESRWVEFYFRGDGPIAGKLKLQKIGQYPRPLPILSRELMAGLGEIGQVLYLKAVESRNQDMGIGALAYLRRVVEDAMDSLLDLMKSAVVGVDNEAELLAAIEKAKQEKVFANKVGFSKAILPPRFFHAGHNPIERLHDWASAGIHNMDDWECLEVFDDVRGLFELLFERLAHDQSERKLYESKLSQLSRKR